MMLPNYCLDICHFVDKEGASFVPMSYFETFTFLVSIDISRLKVADHCEEGGRDDIEDTDALRFQY